MSLTGNGLFVLYVEGDSGLAPASPPLPLDEFVRHVDALGPQKVRRQTKSDIAFEKQLVRKSSPSS